MAGLTNAQIAAITAALSAPRMSRFVAACANDAARAVELYRWNAEISRPAPRDGRRMLHSRLEEIRKLRNRIAHHEPIFDRALAHDYSRIIDVISWTSPEAMSWLRSFEKVTRELSRRP
jgi:hypothetical protein